MYLWRRLASQQWWSDNGKKLGAAAGDGLAIIERPNRKQLQLEVACRSRSGAQELAREFGGRVEKLPTGWLKRFSRELETKPLRIAKRLRVVRRKPEGNS